MSEELRSGVRAERRGGIAIWTIDRPDRANALSRDVVRELGRLAREAGGDRSLRGVVITGAGDRVFSAGADLKERQGMSEEEVRDFLSLYRVSFGAIDRLPVPVVAALDGSAYGGGLELALACDLRVAAAHVEVGLTETSLGIIPGAGGTQRLVRLVGPARAKRLILFARRISATEAHAIGLVDEVAPAGRRALDVALQWLEPMQRAAPIAIAAALEAIDAATETPLEVGLSVERTCYERTLGTEDRLEALAAFREKRPPVFRGR
ncbi:MAG: enoyl-CoA hydratase-related protein [Myxococcota bacterium]|nr:enoyl-CoA hydratase-related protein [Myxococcota bacterium]MDW8361333.1 enoyl-CoA hydratase-related protein [Myxococcales bacterium]